jgi:hypothetical protein
MKNLKKYLVLSPDYIDDADYPYEAKLKVVNGFTRNNVEDVFDIQEDWKSLGGDLDKLYFFPGSSVPRFKVRENYTCTITPGKATAAFLNKDTLEGNTALIHYKDIMSVDASDVIAWAKTWHSYNKYNLLKSILDNGNIEAVFFDREFWNGQYYNEQYSAADLSISELSSTKSRYSYQMEATDSCNQLLGINKKSNLNDLTCDVFLEKEILNVLNEGNITIDENKYNELRSFGQTGEKENQILMMELMSNSDFDESVMYLLFLLKEFGAQISKYKEVKHVNFKSLLSFLTLNSKDIKDISLGHMTRALKARKKFTKKNAGTISQLYAGEYVSYGTEDMECWVEGPVLRKEFEQN